ncbi:MAG: Spx/MgsR family RNA polymerase-binding regulatory protein [Porphyrobacter sp.]|nr:Spx/MgsR family RNA polymerase-binding regulatory protein [Porphyrobacter sp.]
MTIHLYGIPNCDTVKKARLWLDKRERDYTFHDYKKEGADPDRLAAWIAAAGLDAVVNRKGTTFRKLTEADKALAQDSHTAVTLLVQQPSLVKRPVVEYPGGILVGFKEEEWSAALP